MSNGRECVCVIEILSAEELEAVWKRRKMTMIRLCSIVEQRDFSGS